MQCWPMVMLHAVAAAVAFDVAVAVAVVGQWSWSNVSNSENCQWRKPKKETTNGN